MQTNAIPTSAPGDRAPTSEEPALIKMTNQQQTKLHQVTLVRTMWPPYTLPLSREHTNHCAPPHSSVTSARAPEPEPPEAARTLHLLTLQA